MGTRKAQGAFEYMMSYGWAVLVIVVLAVVLWNLGVFNPTMVTQSVGFSVIRPVAWNFVGGNSSTAYVQIALSNIGGVDLKVGVNGTNSNYTMRFKKSGGPNCGFVNQSVTAKDEVGETLSLLEDPVNGISTVDITSGSMVVLNGTIVGAGSPYLCGGASGSSFIYTVSYPYALDQYNIQHSDSGTVSGDYQ